MFHRYSLSTKLLCPICYKIVAKMSTIRLTDATCRTRPPETGYLEIWDTDLKGFGIRISPKGRRSFMVLTRVDGKQRRTTLGTFPETKLADARDAARQIIADARRGVAPGERQRQERQHRERRRAKTFSTLAEQFIADHASTLRTGDETARLLRKHAVPRFGEVPAEEITRAEMRAFLTGIAENTPIQAVNLRAAIRKMYNWAKDHELLDVNPAAGRLLNVRRAEREKVLTADEIAKVWQAAEAIGYPFGPFTQALMLLLQRRDETAGMRWSELDLDTGTWSIPGERAKNGKGHVVPLAPQAIALLKSLPITGDCVFSSGRSSRKLAGPAQDFPISGFSKAKKQLDALSGVEGWTFHDLRRTGSTHMRSIGVDRLAVSKVLNHAESGVTAVYDRYSMDPEKRNALERWANQVDRILGGQGSNEVDLRAAASYRVVEG